DEGLSNLDRANLSDPTTLRLSKSDAAKSAPNIPTWYQPQQQSIPYIPVTPLPKEHDMPPIPPPSSAAQFYYPDAYPVSHLSTPYGQQSNIPPIPEIPTPSALHRSSRRFTLPLVFAILVLLLLAGLA